MRVLLVEDDPVSRQTLAHVLRERGHAVVGFGEIERAWATYRQQPFPLVLVDWMVSGADGSELCRRIRAHPDGDHSVVLVITGLDGSDSRGAVLAAGADDYLTKPYNLAALEVRLAVAERQVAEIGARKRAEGRLRALYEVAIAISGVLDPGRLAHLVVDRARDLLETAGAGLYWWEPEAGYLRALAENDRETSLLEPQLKPGQGTIGQAFQRAEPVVVENYACWEHATPGALAQGVRSALSVPLLVDERTLGALVVRTYTPRHFLPDQVELLRLFAAQVGPALEAARLYSEAECRRAEAEARAAELAASEARFQQMAEHITEVFWLTTPEKDQMLYISPAYEEVWGRPSAELYISPQAWLDAIHPMDHERVRQAALSIKVEGAYDEQYRVVRPDGTVRWIRDRAFPIRDDQGRVYRIAGLAEDITERKRAEEERAQRLAQEMARVAAEAEERRLAFLAEASEKLAGSLDYEATLRSVAQLVVPDLADWCTINLLQHDGQIQPVAATHQDPSKAEALALLAKYYPPKAGGSHPMVQVLRSNKPLLVPEVTEEWLMTHSQNEEHQQLHRLLGNRSYMCVPLIARERLIGTISFFSAQLGRYGPADLPLAEDLARRIALAVDNAHLYRQAQQALRARDEFLSIAAHELRTPVATIQAFCELLEEWLAGRRRPDEMRAVQAIARQTEQLRRLVQDLLDVARLELGQLELRPREFDLGKLAAQVVQHQQALTERHQLRLRRDGAAPVRADRNRIEQVLVNLVNNAIKFSPHGGEIETRVVTSENEVITSVTDNGIGIPANRQRQLFERFYQAHTGTPHDYGGVGIGLYLCRQFVTRHGGRIWCESDEGRGSTFTFTVPLKERKISAQSVAQRRRSRDEHATPLTARSTAPTAIVADRPAVRARMGEPSPRLPCVPKEGPQRLGK